MFTVSDLVRITVIAAYTLAIASAASPGVGDAAIAFELPDQNGVRQTIASLSGPRGLMLVFYRSADW